MSGSSEDMGLLETRAENPPFSGRKRCPDAQKDCQMQNIPVFVGFEWPTAVPVALGKRLVG
jgi:hypothetical protein